MSTEHPLVLINAFEVPEGERRRVRRRMGVRPNVPRDAAGLRRNGPAPDRSPDSEFRFVNVAHWQTAEEFQAAATSDEFRAAAAGLAQFRSHPGLYRVVST